MPGSDLLTGSKSKGREVSVTTFSSGSITSCSTATGPMGVKGEQLHDDSETTGAAALAREADTPRLRCAEPADLGTRESVWPIRSRHEYAIGVAVIEMAPGDTTVGSTPRSEAEKELTRNRLQWFIAARKGFPQ